MGKRIFAELLGTFCLTFAVTAAVARESGLVGVALALGLMVMVMVYAVGRVSGAHLNPAVTFGMVLAKRMSIADAVPYWIAQCIGAVLASALLWALLPHPDGVYPYVMGLGQTVPYAAGAEIRCLLMEIVLTFFLMLVVLRVADGPKEMSLLAGIAVGGVLAMDVLVGGTMSGASMNPARSLGPALILMKFPAFWIYILGPMAGASLAVVADKVLGEGGVKQTT